jgi:CDP-diglyceride synthetase
MALSEIHARLATSYILFMAIAAAWNLVAAARRRGVSGTTFGILVIAELLALGQAALGIALALSGDRPARAVHILYGLTTVLTLPAYYAFSKGRDDRTASLIYAGLCLFLAVAGYRAVLTGA